MNVIAPLVAYCQSTEAVKPSDGALDDPPEPAEGRGRLDTASRNAGLNPTESTGDAAAPMVVGLVRMQLGRAAARSAPPLSNRPDGIEHAGQLVGVGLVGRTEHRARQRDAVSVDDDVVLGSELSAIGRVRTRLSSASLRPNAGGIQRGPRPVDASLLTEVVVQDLQNTVPDARLLPIAQAAPAGHPAAAPHLLGQQLPWDTRPQDEDDASESRSVRNWRAAAVGFGLLGGQEWFDEFPEFVGENRWCHSGQNVTIPTIGSMANQANS